MYNHKKRYRCTIIRGKAQSEIEDLIPIYSDIIISCEGLDKHSFKESFNHRLSSFVPSPTEKTLDNHRTEIASKLYGMYFFHNNCLVPSNRTRRVYEDKDLPAFFKSIVSTFQFPNGMDAIHTIQKRINDKINIRPFHLLLSLLLLASKKNITLFKREVAYYVLDNLDALRGIATPKEILNSIIKDRDSGLLRNVEYFDQNNEKKASSYSMQHISEQINILELSNLISQASDGHEKKIILNEKEKNFIDKIVSEDYKTLPFNPLMYSDIATMRVRWEKYYCLEENKTTIPSTQPFALFNSNENTSYLQLGSPLDIGDEGEKIVFDYEKARVSQFNSRLAQQKVLLLGKQRGLGYDIQSVWANEAEEPINSADETFFIEVKSTKRVTQPKMNASDSLVLTRNEYVAAKQHKTNYAIYRVYITSKGVFVYKIFNPLYTDTESNILCKPIKYNYEFVSNRAPEQWL